MTKYRPFRQFTMVRDDAKETKGCFRYALEEGDPGCETIYIKKISLGKESAPRTILVTIDTAVDRC